MATMGQDAIIQAVRAVQLTSSVLSNAGIFFGRAPRETELPYALNMIVSFPPVKVLGTPVKDAFRYYRLQAKICVGDARSQAIASPLIEANYALFAQNDTITGATPQQRLNTYLNPLGWRALIPLEVGDIQPYTDYVGAQRDIVRWHFGNQFDLRIEKI